MENRNKTDNINDPHIIRSDDLIQKDDNVGLGYELFNQMRNHGNNTAQVSNN